MLSAPALRDLVHEASGLYSQDEQERVYDCPACALPLRFPLDGTTPNCCDAGCNVEAITAAARRPRAAVRPPKDPRKVRKPVAGGGATSRVMAAVKLHGCGYVVEDVITAVCPICERGMAVRFIGDRDVKFACPTGCRESRIVAEIFGGDEVDTRDEEIADLRERVDRLLWLVGFLRDLAFEPCPFCDDGQVVS